MLFVTYFCLLVIVVILNIIVTKIFNRKFNLYLILSVIWELFILAAIITNGLLGNYPKIGIESIFISNLFLIFVGITLIIINKILNSKKYKYPSSSRISYDFSYKSLLILTNLLLIFYIIAQVLYWIDVNRVIGIMNVLNNPNLLKGSIIEGTINEYSFKYVGRNTPIIGTFLVTLFIMKRKKIHLLIIVLYFMMSLVNVRRDPLLIQIIYMLVPLIIMDTKGFKKNFKYFVLVGVIFIIFFLVTLSVLTFGTGLRATAFASYTFGTFNSLQYLIINGYSTSSNIGLSNSFYWIYSLIEFVTGIEITPEVIMDSIPHGTNVYTGLSAIFVDGQGDTIITGLIFFVYQLYVGVLMGLSMHFMYKKTTIFSLSFFAASLSAVIRFYLVPTFSNTEVIYAIVLGVIFQVIYNTLKEKRFLYDSKIQSTT